MNYTKLFYWLTVADNAKTMFIAFIVIFTETKQGPSQLIKIK